MSYGARIDADLPDSEKAKIRDIFIDLMKEKGFIDFTFNPNNNLDVNYEPSPDQEFVKEICGDLSYNIVKLKGTKETKKLYTKIKKKANKIEGKMRVEAYLTYLKKKGVITLPDQKRSGNESEQSDLCVD